MAAWTSAFSQLTQVHGVSIAIGEQFIHIQWQPLLYPGRRRRREGVEKRKGGRDSPTNRLIYRVAYLDFLIFFDFLYGCETRSLRPRDMIQ
jgi:hypothetical protein